MSETTVAKISRPQLRGLLAGAIKQRLIVGTVIAIGSAIFYKVAVCMPRKQKYADFYKYTSYLFYLLIHIRFHIII